MDGVTNGVTKMAFRGAKLKKIYIKNRNKSQKGKFSRRKGHQFEREVAILFRKIFPGARRQLEYHTADCNGVDISGTGHYRVQCKRGRKYASFTAIKEVTADEFMGQVPVLVTQGDNERILVALPLEEFLRLIG